MQTSFRKILSQFDYHLPENLIAQEPASPRDTAKLLVYNKTDDKICFDTFANLGKYLPKNAVLVFNQTRVIPARLTVTKPTGGKAELLYLGICDGLIKALSNKPLKIGTTVTHLHGRANVLLFDIIKKSGQFYCLKPNFQLKKWHDILRKYGQTPLPPYIKHSKLTEKQKREKYQAVFAKKGVSVAAPTASLHFTPRLINKLKQQGIGTAFVQLDVNLGTFAPLHEEQMQSNKLHQEFYNIDKTTADFLNKAKAAGQPIIAVGTTVVRTLESAADNHHLTKLSDQTDLFIKENYKFKFVDGMITNFHVPKSSLLMLVSALAGREKLFDLYRAAITNNFRFFSFGDGMLVLP